LYEEHHKFWLVDDKMTTEDVAERNRFVEINSTRSLSTQNKGAEKAQWCLLA
jgi:hypothetical protein